jgi:hypothetical protein
MLKLYQITTNKCARIETEDSHDELYPLASKSIRDYLWKLAQLELEQVVRRDIINAVIER